MTSSFAPADRTQLKTAVDEWIADSATAVGTYGDISTWDVGAVTDFSELFKDANSFNEDISSWDVSSGTDFSWMFYQAYEFNSDITSWDVSSGIDFSYMFYDATEFNQDLRVWTVDPSAYLADMFLDATAMLANQPVDATPDISYFVGTFAPVNRTELKTAVDEWIADSGTAQGNYGHISSWDVGSVTDFSELFKNANTFNEDISDWNVRSGINFSDMFSDATEFNQDLSV